MALDDALSALAKFDERRSHVVELRFFGGLSVEETAAVLRISPETVMRDWKLARTWLTARVAEMTPERWQQVSRIYSDALARDFGERASFLREACQDDEALRQEVESLLAQPASAENFLGEPALAMAPGLMDDPAEPALTGQRLGVYHILDILGVGGMGEVYRARDTRLGRDVAVKVLPRLFSADPERLARFEREARLLASLNHPHIAAIYGFEETAGIHALVLELVEGPTLAERLQRGPLPIAEAVRIARQIADALEAAHERGVVHRDLKPQNIKVKPDGTVKVLDFGLAKATMAAAHDGDGSPASTAPIDGTREGVILGTTSYMSPEQSRGHAVDKRTDIWAFGCVFYEMLTGRATFAGETISDTLAAVLKQEPDWQALPADTPPGVRSCCVDVSRKIPSIDCTTSPTRESRFRRPSPSLRRRHQPARHDVQPLDGRA